MQRYRFKNEIKNIIQHFIYLISDRMVRLGQQLRIDFNARHLQDGLFYLKGQNIPGTAEYVDHGNWMASFKWRLEKSDRLDNF